MKHVKRVGIVINAKAILVALLAVTSMMVCRHFGLSADFPLTLIATAVVFPIVFSINSAYKRREAALAAYGGVKAHGRAIYFAARDWLADDDPETVDRISRLLGGLLSDCRTLFSTPVNAMQAEVEASRSTELEQPESLQGRPEGHVGGVVAVTARQLGGTDQEIDHPGQVHPLPGRIHPSQERLPARRFPVGAQVARREIRSCPQIDRDDGSAVDARNWGIE